MKYPFTRSVDVKDVYFGTEVSDPFRWLEDDQSDETKAWVIEQNKCTNDYLDKIPFRAAIQERLFKLMDYEKFSQPFKEGKYTYFYRNTGLQNQSVLYRQRSADEEAEVFIDPNTFSADASDALAGISFSKDGSLAAYRISKGGSDWTRVVVIDTETKQPTGDVIHNVKFSGIAWYGNTGFYYSTYEQPRDGSQLSARTDQHKLYFHELGKTQEEDQLIFGDQVQRRYIGAGVTEDERYLVISAANTTSGNELYIKDLSQPEAAIVTVIDNLEKNHEVLLHENGKLYIYTNLHAANGRIVTVDPQQPGPEHWQGLIPETENVLTPSTGAGKIFANYLKDAISMVQQYSLDGILEKEIELPGPGTAVGFHSKNEETTLYYTFTSYIFPATIFSYNVLTGQSELYRKSGVDFDPSGYESNQVFYTSKDGTRVPMIITHKKGLERNGKNPTVVYGYGGFNVNLTPAFSNSIVVLLEQGAVYAVANLRGGGEYGDDWHLAGTKMNKQHVFDDFIAAAEYLIAGQYTSSDYLASMGGSNGGLLVAATMAQRPELFKVALPAVGVLDMLRYHQFTAGAGWSYDYGTASDSKEMFEYLYQYSPLHALKEGVAYPATFVTTGDHDDRVVPAHSFKFIARLQQVQSAEAPVLIRIETNAGHGAGKPMDKVIAEIADKWAFMFQVMGLQWR
ncbi:prolyl oligopeptidase family serine peptidase [Pedobacter sp. SAFR-022]|uniref:prolyl oligopeptidase family serine peptidase n=1 Tax=Pedobacter sp. SAFR-022 TaxID=3436861 RepID=UPI003F822E1B